MGHVSILLDEMGLDKMGLDEMGITDDQSISQILYWTRSIHHSAGLYFNIILVHSKSHSHIADEGKIIWSYFLCFLSVSSIWGGFY